MPRLQSARRSWFGRAISRFDATQFLSQYLWPEGKRNASARLRLLSLEERVVPALSMTDYDIVGVVGKTVSVKVGHDQTSGTVNGNFDWGDGTTTTFSGWSYTEATRTITHNYSKDGKFIQQLNDDLMSGRWKGDINVRNDLPPELAPCPIYGCVQTDKQVQDIVIAQWQQCGAGADPGFGVAVGPNNYDPGYDRPAAGPAVDSGIYLRPVDCPANASNEPSQTSEGPVRYADGTVQLSFTDIGSNAFGTGYFLTRSWTNAPGYAANSSIGGGWVESSLPSVKLFDEDTYVLISNGTSAYFFDQISSEPDIFAERYSGLGTLEVLSGGDIQVTTSAGVRFLFDDEGSGQSGEFISRTDPSGNVTEVVSRNGSGQVTRIERSMSGLTEGWDYTYSSGRLASVTLEQIAGSTTTTLRSVEYSYYGSSEANGNDGDLEFAKVYDGSSNLLGSRYYRYYQPSDANGFAGALKFVVDYASYDRVQTYLGTTTLTLDTLSDSTLLDYADYYFEYDSSRRVSAERVQGAGCSTCSGGVGLYTFDYTASAHSPGVNSWAMKTVETLPDGSRHVVFTNADGQVMLFSTQEMDGESVEREWASYAQYDENNRVVLATGPSGLSGYDPAYADLVHFVSNNAEFLNDSSGLFSVLTYAETTGSGDVAGYLQSTAIRHGETGDNVPQTAWTYDTVTDTSTGVTIHPPTSRTVYRNDDGTGGLTTTYTWSFDSGTTQLVEWSVDRPAADTDQNGPGGTTTETASVDSFGRVVWTRDADGFLTYRAYDDATGYATKVIRDVDTSLGSSTGGYANLPSGWTTPGGGGLHLVETYELDALGRAIVVTSPEGNVTYVVYNDEDHSARIYSGWDSTAKAPTGPTVMIRTDRLHNYSEVVTFSDAPALTGSIPNGSESIGTMQSLSRSIVNDAGQLIETHRYFDLTSLSYSTAQTLSGATDTADFSRSLTDYGQRGWVKRTETPNGTITRYIQDALGRVTEVWIGTDDEPTSDYWSPSNNAGANMVRVRTFTFDSGSVGDGNLTLVTEIPGLSVADRWTETYFDWRNRPVVVKQGGTSSPGSESTTVNRPLGFVAYDNLNRVVQAEQYDGDQYAVSYTDGVPDAPSASLRRARVTSEFDDAGRTWRTRQWSVDPADGDVGDALTSQAWFSLRGQVVKSESPNSGFRKSAYDGVGRVTASYVLGEIDDTTYACVHGDRGYRGRADRDGVRQEQQRAADGGAAAVPRRDGHRRAARPRRQREGAGVLQRNVVR